jgi:hypothetical protein
VSINRYGNKDILWDLGSNLGHEQFPFSYICWPLGQ